MYNVSNFRFWCQKVLPLVYDDSLSYYELLCKVVDYLNKVISDVGEIISITGDLQKSFNELKSYVDNYFNSLDVQEEINNKLDAMAADGSLDSLINKYINTAFFTGEPYVTLPDLMNLSFKDAYDSFDEYVESGVLTKTLIGYGSTSGDQEEAAADPNLPIYMYSWVRPVSTTYNFPLSNYNRKILLIGAMHGNEKSNIPIMLTMLYNWTHNRNKFVDFIFNNFNVDFVPVLNPYGFDLSIGTTMMNVEENIGRTNVRGVNINRNGVSGWRSQPEDAGGFNYKGKAPASEQETKTIEKLCVDKASDYIFIMDIHNERYSASTNLTSRLLSPSTILNSIFGNVMSMMYENIKEKYGFDVVSGMSPETSLVGGLSAAPYPVVDANNAKGSNVFACLYEAPRYNDGEITPVRSQKMTCDVVITFMYYTLKFLQEYNSSRNSAYTLMYGTERLRGNMISQRPQDWKYGSVTDTSHTDGLASRITPKVGIPLKENYDYKIKIISQTNEEYYYSLVLEGGTLPIRWVTWNNGEQVITSGGRNMLYPTIARTAERTSPVVLNSLGTDFMIECIEIGPTAGT